MGLTLKGSLPVDHSCKDFFWQGKVQSGTREERALKAKALSERSTSSSGEGKRGTKEQRALLCPSADEVALIAVAWTHATAFGHPDGAFVSGCNDITLLYNK